MGDRDRWWRLAPLAAVLLLAAAWLAPPLDVLRLAGDDEAVGEWDLVLEGIPADGIVLVAFDPDLGTYPEIRSTVRVAVADLMARGLRPAFVSLTPEGRALLLVELERLERLTVNPARLIDVGFIPGAEAAIVALADGPPLPPTASGALARELVSAGSDAVDAVLVIGGIDLGPRAWIEQYLPRVDPVPLLAIAPTFLLPDLVPYLETGLLDALVGTVADGAAYRGSADLGPLDRMREDAELKVLPVLVGLLIGLGVLAEAAFRRVRRRGHPDARSRRDAA